MDLIAIYFFIGFVYCLINVGVRNIDSDDYLRPFFWFLLWPLAAIAWLFILTQNIYKRIQHKI